MCRVVQKSEFVKGHCLSDTQYMHCAIEQATQAEIAGEVPVGAVAVWEGRIIARGRNCSIGDNDPTAHAEIIALRNAASYLKNYRLPNLELYVTLEPCAMCFSAMIHARVSRLVYGASDTKSGVCGGVVDFSQMTMFNHQITVAGGVLADECSRLLIDFFRDRRAI